MIELLRETKRKNTKNIDPNKGRHHCNNCLSTGINPDSIPIYEPCFSCSGNGHLTWIENATKERRTDVNRETVEACSLNNIIHSLIYLTSSFRKLNIGHVSITVNLDGVDKNNKSVKKLVNLLKEYGLL